MGAADRPAFVVLGRREGAVDAALLDAGAEVVSQTSMTVAAFEDWVPRLESTASPRWVWNDTPGWYNALLDRGTRIARCHDLRLCRAILQSSASVPPEAKLSPSASWAPVAASSSAASTAPALFEIADVGSAGPPDAIDDLRAEFAAQRAAVGGAREPGRLRLLLAAESAGALVAAEMRAAGLPWDAAEHDRILTRVLGERGAGGEPAHLAESARRVRTALDDPALSLDSQPRLLRALHRAGVLVQSTSRWELAEHTHPVIAPLLEYKKLARLQSANGWGWLAEWVADGRFRPVYVPGGVVTGRWASSGGGALQLPRQLREAVRADPGWRLVVADVAQLEPQVLAAMSGDTALAHAAHGRDLYAGVAESGAVPSRQEAKIAILGAMYGATTGDSGRLVPRLRRAYPRAMALVDEAARVGEDGGVVSTWLGRSSPRPETTWAHAQSRASEAGASPAEIERARRSARDRGRFTRNFIVQGTAAEWALCWLAELRTRLAGLPHVDAAAAAPRSGRAFARQAHIAFFLHDEVIVHAPEEQAEAVAQAVSDAAAEAGRILFGVFPVDFPLDVRVDVTAAKD